MGTEAVIPMFTDIAIGTKNLKPRWIPVSFKPSVEGAWSFNFPTVVSAIVIYMVNFEKKRMGFSATNAPIAAVSHNRFMAKQGKAFTASFWMFFVPSGSDYYPALLTYLARLGRKITRLFEVMALNTLDFHKALLSILIITLSDYQSKVKGKVQRPSREGVGASVPKRIAARTAEDMVCSAWEHAAAL